ncbi:hypothetical protein FXO38_29900 [Capsicum annuum]|uniref:uncharacterized protein LOC107859582 n=1 Tax=Capsicum annuum TaxID=4072 RepID=UPI0007BF619B|nr:uncharacterized protein LOC107859582 [Capsicum annuum]KAF3625152.1 hypothetical protein FXO38_29900 [Capsicum annuum]KAF3649811.1 hypothetical protein FXO37_18776 [Capsicum annuum]
MAKGRKLASSRSEMLLGSYNSYTNGSVTVNGSSELGEDDIWSAVDDMANGVDHSRSEWSPRAAVESNRSFSAYLNRRQTAPRADQQSRSGRQAGGLSLAFDDPSTTASPRILHQFRGPDAPSPRVMHMATSAPVNVPDWSKIYRVDSVESLHENDSDDGADDDTEMVPPHEYLARSRNSNAHSVFEGVGRTLKGRDLSRVRDAVWSQTGFDG